MTKTEEQFSEIHNRLDRMNGSIGEHSVTLDNLNKRVDRHSKYIESATAEMAKMNSGCRRSHQERDHDELTIIKEKVSSVEEKQAVLFKIANQTTEQLASINENTNLLHQTLKRDLEIVDANNQEIKRTLNEKMKSKQAIITGVIVTVVSTGIIAIGSYLFYQFKEDLSKNNDKPTVTIEQIKEIMGGEK